MAEMLNLKIKHLQALIEATHSIGNLYPTRWLAINLLEGDQTLKTRLAVLVGGQSLQDEAQTCINRLERIYGDETDIIIADYRYGWINGLVREAVKRTRQDRLTSSDRIDSIVTKQGPGYPHFSTGDVGGIYAHR